MRILLIIFLLMGSSVPQAMALTLDEAIEAALQNHQRIVQFSANVDQAQAAVGSARATFMPRVDLDYSYLERDEDPYSYGEKSSILAVGASFNLGSWRGRADRQPVAGKDRCVSRQAPEERDRLRNKGWFWKRSKENER